MPASINQSYLWRAVLSRIRRHNEAQQGKNTSIISGDCHWCGRGSGGLRAMHLASLTSLFLLCVCVLFPGTVVVFSEH